MKKAIGYVRVSERDKSLWDGFIESQKESIRLWLKFKESDLGPIDIEFIEDRGISGFKDSRCGLDLVKEKLKSGEYSLLIVKDLSRVFRNTKATLDFFTNVIEKHNINFISLSESVDTQSASGKMFLTILSAMNQYYRDHQSEKMIHCKSKMKNAGKFIGGLRAFGIKKTLSGLVEANLEEQEIIKLIIELKNEGNSYDEIRRILNDRKIKTSLNKEWHPASIRNIYMRNK